MILGVTGGIATGKSTILNILKKKMDILNLDELSHKIINDSNVIKELVTNFGEGILENGVVNRKKLGKIVFEDKEKLKILNNIMHKRIISKMNEIIAKYRLNNKNLAVEVPLLFELGLESYFDKIILAYAPKELQIKRVMNRDNKSYKEAISVINSQMDIEEKRKRADIISDNTKSINDLERTINENIKI